jgi:hypothetical protein
MTGQMEDRLSAVTELGRQTFNAGDGRFFSIVRDSDVWIAKNRIAKTELVFGGGA